jgi:hypothetical protein
MSEEAMVEEVPAGWVHEHKVAGGWGMRVSELAEYRKVYLRPEYHWRRYGLRIFYSREGIEVAKRHFNAPEPEELYRRKVEAKVAEVERWAGPPTAGTELSLTVCRVMKGCRNPRMIRVVNSEGRLAHIMVRSALNFREGMLVDLGSCKRCRYEPDGHPNRATLGMERPIVYELMIPLPRFVGRWGYDGKTEGYIGRSGAYFKRRQEVARTPARERITVWWRRQGGGQ